MNGPKTAVFRNMGIYKIENTPWNRWAVGAFSCFTNTLYFLVKNESRLIIIILYNKIYFFYIIISYNNILFTKSH